MSQGPLLQTNTWQQVTLDVGEMANAKQLQSLVLTFGFGDLNGPFRGFVDSVALTHPASS